MTIPLTDEAIMILRCAIPGPTQLDSFSYEHLRALKDAGFLDDEHEITAAGRAHVETVAGRPVPLTHDEIRLMVGVLEVRGVKQALPPEAFERAMALRDKLVALLGAEGGRGE